jgi:hypothetical protein
LYTPKNALELDEWGHFKKKFKTLLENIKELIITKLHGGTKMWCMQHRSLIIDAIELTKYKRWLPLIVCIITLIFIKGIFAIHHSIQFLVRR